MRGNSGSGGWVGPHPSGWADLGRDLEGRWELAIDLKGGSVPCTFEEEQRGQRGWSRVGQGEGGRGEGDAAEKRHGDWRREREGFQLWEEGLGAEP